MAGFESVFVAQEEATLSKLLTGGYTGTLVSVNSGNSNVSFLSNCFFYLSFGLFNIKSLIQKVLLNSHCGWASDKNGWA